MGASKNIVIENFIKDLIDNQTPVAVFLKNGIKLTGRLTGSDVETLLLTNTITQLIYKDAVSTILPSA